MATCPACNGKRTRPLDGFTQVDVCKRCGGIFGTCYKGESYRIRLPYWETDDPNASQENWVYYNLTILGSEGIEYEHGWFHRQTKKILQTG